jgi:hypothetical protein
MRALFITSICVICMCGMSLAQAKDQLVKRVILPNIELIRCMTADCFQLLQNEPPRPGDIYPEHIDVAFLDRWCPFGLTARYNKAVSFDDLKVALEKRYGKGATKNWTDIPSVIWEVEPAHVIVELKVVDKRMSQKEPLEEGTKLLHYDDKSDKICPLR